MKQRVAYLDIAKGIAVLLVVISHSYNVINNYFHLYNDVYHFMDEGLQWMYMPFFMPLFFVITGWCSNFDLPFKNFLWKNIKQLIFPSITLLLIDTWILVAFGISSPPRTLGLFGVLLNLATTGGPWFIAALFFSKLMYWGLRRVFRKINIQLVIGLILFLIIGLAICFTGWNGMKDFYFLIHACFMLFFLPFGKFLKGKVTNRMLLIGGGYLYINASLMA